MTEPDKTPQKPPADWPRTPVKKRIGVGMALVLVPVGAAYVAWQAKGLTEERDSTRERGFAYDVEGLRQVDPALVKYREVGRIATAAGRPSCMAVAPDGRLLIGAPGLVRVLDDKGAVLKDIAVSGLPECLAATGDGRILVGMRDHVEVYGADGRLERSWASLGGRAYIACISVAGADVWVADAGRRVVLRCTMDGKVEAEVGREDASRGVPGLIVPSPHMDVRATADGSVWVANPGRHQLELYSREGELLRTWGKLGTSIDAFYGCCNPSNFALLSDGKIVTAEKGVARVKMYDADGKFDSVVAAPDGFGANRAGLHLAADAGGRVLVLEPGTDAVRVFAREGIVASPCTQGEG